MKTTATTGTLLVEGSHGLTFEFKVRQGQLAFIRYREGEREFAGTEYIRFDCYEDYNRLFMVEQALSHRGGVNRRVIRQALALIG